MKIQRIQNTKRNVVFGLANKMVTLFLPFVVRTVLIKRLGVDYLGLNGLFSSILQVLNLSDLGFSSAIVYAMYKPIADDDDEQVCAILAYFRRVYQIIGVVILGLGLCVLPFLPRLINGTPPADVNIYLLYMIYLLNAVVSYTLVGYKTVIPTALQRTDITSNIHTVAYGMMSVLQIVILMTVSNYYVYLLMMPLSTVVNNLLVSRKVDREYSQYVCRGELDLETRRQIKTKVMGLMVHRVCQVSRNSLDSICVSAFLGLTVTAIYTNYYYIMSTIIGFTAVITLSMLSGVGNSIVTESVEKNYNDLRKFNFIYMWFGGWCTVCLLCLYQPFMELWVGPELMFPFGVVIAFVVYFYALKMGDIRGVYSDACGLWWENRYRAVAESIANIVLNIVLVQFWGVYGIIVATLISLLIINFGFGSQIVFHHYFKNGKLAEYFLDHLKYVLVTAVICVITAWVGQRIIGSVWLVLIGRGLLCCVLPNVLYWLIYRRTKIYKTSMPWLFAKLHLDKKLKWLL